MTSLPPDATGDPTRVSWIADEFFQSLRRLYSGTPQQALSELFQNSQRAGATTVEITFTCSADADRHLNGFIYQDNGHGLQDGVAGVLDLLRLGVSHYDTAAIAEQAPMGMGFFALLAVPDIEQVVVESDDIQFHLEPAKWWSSTQYRDDWLRRYRDTASSATVSYRPGFRLTVVTTRERAAQFAVQLPATIHDGWSRTRSRHPYPAEGYAGLLDIRVDGAPIQTALRPALGMTQSAEELFGLFTYQGNHVRVVHRAATPYSDPHPDLVIVWYGQPIVVNALPEIIPDDLSVLVEVTTGQPLHPRAPAREGLIEDEALVTFGHWLREALFARLTDPATDADMLQGWQLAVLWRLDRRRFEDESPYVVVKRWIPLHEARERYVLEDYSSADRLDDERVMRRDELDGLLLLNRTVVLALPAPAANVPRLRWEHATFVGGFEHQTYSCGIASLLSAAQLTAYQVTVGSAQHQQLWYRPGSFGDGLWSREPGAIGLTEAQCGTPPDHWEPLPEGVVVYLLDGESADTQNIAYVDFFVAAPDLAEFLKKDAALLWCEDPDGDDEECWQVFEQNIDDLLRTYYHPHSVSWQISLRALAALPPTPQDAVASIELIYDQYDQTASDTPNADTTGEAAPSRGTQPTAIRLTTTRGTVIERSVWR